MKKEMVGVCRICGNVEIRPSPCDVAVCGECYSHNPQLVSIVQLKTPAQVLRQIAGLKHPDLRFELSSKIPITHTKGKGRLLNVKR